MSKYETCPKCKESAVHLAMATIYEFYGDQDDDEGDESIYADETPLGGPTEVSLFAHICFECGHLVDVGIESPREKAVNTRTCPHSSKISEPGIWVCADCGQRVDAPEV